MGGWRFALPPSLGREPVRALARQFASLLYEAGFTTVWPQDSYARVEERLLGGEADAAWGPPMVCARVESAGGVVALSAIRWGAASYRSVLLARADDQLELSDLGRGRRQPRAVWVDEKSMGGYALPRGHLRALGVDPARAFIDERFGGSYEACLREVLDGNADVTATFSAAASANRPAAGYVELCGFRAIELKVLGYTNECPNDGIVLSPRLSPATIEAIRASLWQLLADPGSRRLLAAAFDVDGFDEPREAGAYRALLDLAP
jgi:phosphonate transport system substrate-binding protein